jgi:hypothetical protein
MHHEREEIKGRKPGRPSNATLDAPQRVIHCSVEAAAADKAGRKECIDIISTPPRSATCLFISMPLFFSIRMIVHGIICLADMKTDDSRTMPIGEAALLTLLQTMR